MNPEQQLHEALSTGESEDGNVEFKKSLSSDIHLADNKRHSLVAQLRHRVLSGDGEATYVIGVNDNGDIEGISEDEFAETVDVLKTICHEADTRIDTVESYTINEKERNCIGLVTITEDVTEPCDGEQESLLVGTAGHVDHGKSTLVGSIVTGEPDNGNGSMRSYLDLQPHEVKRGLSADLSYALYGFNKSDSTVNLNRPEDTDDRSRVVEESEKLVSFVDTVGHEPWLGTAIRGLVGQRLDYGLVVVSAEDGPTKTTKEHLGVLIAMELPTIVCITKTDLVSDERVDAVEREIEKILRDSGCNPLPESRYSTETIINEISDSVIPIVRTSSVTMDGIDTMDTLFKNLPKTQHNNTSEPFKMYIDRTYVVEGIGTVVSGAISSGKVESGDTVFLGPYKDGSFKQTTVRSIEIHYHSVDSATAGTLVSIAVSDIPADEINRGMILSAQKEPPEREFEAEVMILNHPTKVTSGYEPVIHIESICETIVLQPHDPPLLPGETGNIKARFKFNPYVIEEGQRFIFREGSSKGVGTITSVE